MTGISRQRGRAVWRFLPSASRQILPNAAIPAGHQAHTANSRRSRFSSSAQNRCLTTPCRNPARRLPLRLTGKTPEEHSLLRTRTERLMTFSVNTNPGALVALQYLSATQGQLNQTQSAINSGMKVATARDDGAIYAIAQNQRGAVAGYASVINSINNATSSVDVALSAGQSISDLLIQLKAKALAASDSSLDTASRQALNANFTALRDQISTIVKNAVFNGFNLVDGSTTQITALASADGSRRITTDAQNMKLSGSVVTLTTTGTISTQAKASTLVATIQTSLTNVNSALAKLSAGAAKFSIQME